MYRNFKICGILFFFLSIALAVRVSEFERMEVQLGKGLGIEDENEISSETIQKVLDGVEKGNRESIYFFGLMKLYGLSMTKGTKVAAQHFERAAKLGHPEATTAYGMMLMHGEGIERDISLAIQFFKRGVALKDTNAHWLLGKLLLEQGAGANVVRGGDPRLRNADMKMKAEEDEAKAKAEKEASNERDDTTIPTPNGAEAFALFQHAADPPHSIPQSQHLLAVMYEYGMSVPQNFAQAAAYYRQASGQNYWESTYHLALMYAFGRTEDAKQDFRKALALLERAARAEHAPSVYYMGVFKMGGYGCMPDYERALNWFERAAGMGDFRISEKAADAAKELRGLIQKAEDQNNEVLDKYVRMNE